MNKNELRPVLLQKRSEIEDKINKDKLLCQKFLSFCEKAEEVLVYISYKTEVDTHSLIKKLLRLNKKVYAPRCIIKECQMQFCQIKSYTDLSVGAYGILEPNKGLPLLENTNNRICLVPGLAFTKNGHRIGYGKGYYDRFLSENNVISVGFCYEDMLLEQLPVDCFDQKINIILTEKKEVVTNEKQKQL